MKYVFLFAAIVLVNFHFFKNVKIDLKQIGKSTLPHENYFFFRDYPYNLETQQHYKNAIEKEQAKLKKRGGFAWQNEGPYNIGGRINVVHVNPTNSNILYIGTADGGIFKSTNAGSTWTPIFDNESTLPISEIVGINGSPNSLFAGTGDEVLSGYSHLGSGVYKTTNAGNTWTNIGLQNTGAISKIILNPADSNTIYVGTTGNPFLKDTNRGLYKTINGGATWTKILFTSDSSGIGDLVMDPNNSQTLYATTRNRVRSNSQSSVIGFDTKIFKTTDGGSTWTQLSTGLPSGEQCRIGLCIHPTNSNILYALYVDTAMDIGGIFKTTNGGSSWTNLNSNFSTFPAMGNFGWYFGKINIDPVNPNILYVHGVGLHQSVDGGANFDDIAPSFMVHSDKHDLKFVNNSSNNFYLATDGGLYHTVDGGNNFNELNNYPITQFYETAFNPFDAVNYYGGAQDNGSNFGDIGTKNSWVHYFGGDGFRSQFDYTDSNIYYAEWQNGHVVSFDGFGWNYSYTDAIINIAGDVTNWNSPYFISKSNNNDLFFGSYRVWKNDAGPIDNWQPLSPMLTDVSNSGFNTITTLTQSEVNTNILYAGTSDANVWMSNNYGLNWSQINTGLPTRYVTCVEPSPNNVNTVFASLSGYRYNDSLPHLYRSTNNGTTWTNIASNLPMFAINDVWVRKGFGDSCIVVATDGGVYFTETAGASWSRAGNNMPIIPVFDIEYHKTLKRVFVGTFARSMQSVAEDSLFVKKTDTTQSNVAIQEFKIDFNIFPNPVTNKLVLKSANNFYNTIYIYDNTGKLVLQTFPVFNTIDVSFLVKGNYYLQTNFNKAIIRRKFVKV